MVLRMGCVLRCLLLSLSLLMGTAHAQTESRLALLIGNAAYRMAPLLNPVNDVRLMERVLMEAGFTVLKAENASVREMRRLVREFGERLKREGGVGLFYFAGHGVQWRGENFLIGTDADIRHEDEVADESVNASVVFEKMQGAGNRLNLIVLDACRTNPFANRGRSMAAGLAVSNAPRGSLVAFSTAPGSIAFDGTGANSIYTEQLARAITLPGLPVEEVFKRVRAAVRQATADQQVPWENTSLEGQFYFRPVLAAAPAAAPGPSANAAAPSIPPNAPSPGRVGQVIGTLQWLDASGGAMPPEPVSVVSADAERVVYSTGDVVALDGRLLQARIGQVVLRLRSGELWRFPLQDGARGQAEVERVGAGPAATGTVAWSVSATPEGQRRVSAEVRYRVVPKDAAFFVTAAGQWVADYAPGQPLPLVARASLQSALATAIEARNQVSAAFTPQ